MQVTCTKKIDEDSYDMMMIQMRMKMNW